MAGKLASMGTKLATTATGKRSTRIESTNLVLLKNFVVWKL